MTFRQVLIGMTGLVVGAAVLSRHYPAPLQHPAPQATSAPHTPAAVPLTAGTTMQRSATSWNPLDEASDSAPAHAGSKVAAALPTAVDVAPSVGSPVQAVSRAPVPAAAHEIEGSAQPLAETSDVLTKAMLQIEQTKRQLQERQSIIKELEARRRQIQALEKWTESLNAQLAGQAAHLQEVERARAQLSSDIETSQNRIGYLQTQIHELEESKARLFQENQTIAQGAADREAKLLGEQQRAEQALAAKELEVTKLTQDLEGSRAETARLSEELPQTRQQLAQLRSEWEQLHASSETWQQERQRLQEQLAAAHEAQARQVETLNRQVAQLQQAAEDGRRGDRERRKKLEAEVKALREGQRRLQQATSEAIKQAEELARAVKVKDDLIKQLKTALDTRETQLRAAEAGLSKVQGKQQELQQAVMDTAAQADDMSKTLQSREQMVESLRQEVAQQEAQLQQAEAIIRLLERGKRQQEPPRVKGARR